MQLTVIQQVLTGVPMLGARSVEKRILAVCVSVIDVEIQTFGIAQQVFQDFKQSRSTMKQHKSLHDVQVSIRRRMLTPFLQRTAVGFIKRRT